MQNQTHLVTRRRIKTEVNDSSFSRMHTSPQTPICRFRRASSNSRSESKRSQSYLSKLQNNQEKKRMDRTSSPPLNSFNYNKWYIDPRIRMKRSLLKQKQSIQKGNDVQQNSGLDFAYNKLYEEIALDKELPFVAIHNQKLTLLEKIPAHNIKLLDGFIKNQEANRKRVPKIVQLFLKKQNQKIR